MNPQGQQEQRGEGLQEPARGDQLARSPERARAPERKAGAAETRITPGLSDREQVERTADRIRDELLLTLEELDRRRERALDLRYQAARHRSLLIGAALALAGLTGVAVSVTVWRLRHRERTLAGKRRRALKRVWEHPDRVASSAEQRPLAVELGRKLVLIFGTALAGAVAKRSVQTLVPPQHTEPARA